jgi:hypothetical protein
LNLALEAAQGAFKGLAILQMDFCQTNFTTFRYGRPSRTAILYCILLH